MGDEAGLPRGAVRVLAVTTTGFTLMFAVWMMFGVLGVAIRDEFGLSDSQFAWITSVAILNGALWRLPAGIAADRFGGRTVATVMLLFTAIPAFLLSLTTTAESTTFGTLLFYAFLTGFAGNVFTSGVAWVSAWWPRERQGLALGVFGAGNVGASVTNLVGPTMITAVPVAGLLGGIVPGGWRSVPFFYGVLLILMAAVTWVVSPQPDRRPGQGRPVRSLFAPLRHVRVWRFSFYYVVVFGTYVALSSWLPKYYVDVYGLDLTKAALLTALFIFPASLIRPLGGWFSDRIGARRVMYVTFAVMLLASGILMMPYGHIVIERPDGPPSEILPWSVGVGGFTALIVLMGCAMGVGMAGVFKHIPEYFPANVGAVGGIVGSLGALGGFFLPPAFAWATGWVGLPQATFGVLFVVTAIAAIWMHLTVVRILQGASPDFANKFEHDAEPGLALEPDSMKGS